MFIQEGLPPPSPTPISLGSLPLRAAAGSTREVDLLVFKGLRIKWATEASYSLIL